MTERFCQDPLKNCFGHQRSLGARKDNLCLRDFGFNDNAIRNQKVFRPIAGNVRGGQDQSNIEFSCDVSLFHVENKLKRTEYKPGNGKFSSSVSLSSIQACCYKIANFILNSRVTFTKSFSNWLYGGKIPNRLDTFPSGNKFNEKFCGLAMLK